MKREKIICTVLALSMLSSFSAFAASGLTPSQIAKWEADCRKRSNPTAEYEGNGNKASNLVLVASDVWMEYSGAGSAGFGAGYTDVETKDGKPASHYTRVEVRRGNKILAKRTEKGVGYVYAETDDVDGAVNMEDVYAKAFWGENK